MDIEAGGGTKGYCDTTVYSNCQIPTHHNAVGVSVARGLAGWASVIPFSFGHPTVGIVPAIICGSHFLDMLRYQPSYHVDPNGRNCVYVSEGHPMDATYKGQYANIHGPLAKAPNDRPLFINGSF
eukprot:GHVO01049557.1.p1 GENE.GHVO01049557.1~~GHVO01049557.1.p1  ORF type:complete len:125 (-),score=5.88 GHVO01049557.1:245-619(-)